MAAAIFQSTLALFLRKTLDGIVDDTSDEMAASEPGKEFLKFEPMEGAYEDYTSIAGPGLAKEKPEGEDIGIGEMFVGGVLRITARTIGLRMIITREAIEDNKYPQVIRAARMCKRAIYNTRAFDQAAVLVRAWDTTDNRFLCADSLPLCSASHLLPTGATYSNTLSVVLGPSVQAISAVRTAIRKLPALDGLPQQHLMPTKVVHPIEQDPVWDYIFGSSMDPQAGNFSKINVARKWNIDHYGCVYWDNTSTNWLVRTNAEDQVLFKERRKPEGHSWVTEESQNMSYSCTERHTVGAPDPRAFYGSQA